jgi:hypothetical protein
MNDPELKVISDVVDSLPDILLNIECLHLLYVIKGQLSSNTGLRLEAFTTNDEDILLVELAYTKSLSWLLKTGQHDPLLAGNREELACVETLNIWFATILFISVCHSSKDIEVILVLMHHVVSSWVEHVTEWLQK